MDWLVLGCIKDSIIYFSYRTGALMESNKASHSLSSGALAGFVSVLALQPLDVIKTRLQETPRSSLSWHRRLQQTLRAIHQPNGPMGYWRGTLPTLLRNVPGVALYFFTLQQLQYMILVGHQRHWMSSQLDGRLWDERATRPTGLGNMLAGGTARTMAGFLLMPATVIKVRFESRQFQYGSLLAALRQILSQEGLCGLFRGAGATALRDAPHAALYLVLYRRLQALLPRTSGGAEVAKNLTAAATASLAATVITHPLDLAKTRVQLSQTPTNFVSTIVNVVRMEGLLGLFNGMGPRLARKTLSSAITWSVFEYLIASQRP